MRIVICDDCNHFVDSKEDPHCVIEDPWGRATGDICCENCREKRWDRQQETLMEET